MSRRIGSGVGDGWRRGAATYLALFFLGVAAAPHHHVNGLEDLLLDQPSDSGLVVESNGPVGTHDAPAINSFWLVDDSPCLACFTSDFVAVHAQVFAFADRLERLSKPPVPSREEDPDPVPRETSSRAPPLPS